MKIIQNENQISNLVKGEEFILKPPGFNYNEPEKLDLFLKMLEKLQSLIDEKFKTV